MMNAPSLEAAVTKFILKSDSTSAPRFSVKLLLIKFTIFKLQRSLNQAYRLRPDTQ